MSESLLNEQTLDQIRQAGGNEVLRELFEVFLSLLESRRTAALDSIRHEDALAARKAFHTIRSSSVTIGLQALADRAEVLEGLAVTSSWTEISRAQPEFEACLEKSAECLKLEVAKIAADP